MISNELLYPLLAIFAVAAVTWFLRAFPFVLFGNRRLPEKVQYLGKVLPFAIMTVLVIYCLRNIDVSAAPFGIPEISAAILVVVLQCTRKNMYLSIIGGTVFYMVMIRVL